MKPVSDERGRFCSFNTVCGRNCTSRERERCQWWDHAKDEPEPIPLNLIPPLSHAKEYAKCDLCISDCQGSGVCARTNKRLPEVPCGE